MKPTWCFVSITAFFMLVPIQEVSSQPEPADSSYFPLRVGYEWSYSGSYDLTRKITDTTRINDRLFYGMASDGYPPSTWFRESNDSVFVIQSIHDTSEILLYCLAGEIGDTIKLTSNYSCSYGNLIILAGKDDTVSTPSGTYLHCYHFKHVAFCMDAGMMDSWLAKGIGTVKFIQESFVGMRTSTLDSFGVAMPDLSLLAYYPLRTGNYWEYKVERYDDCGFPVLCEDTSAYSVEAAGDTVLLNGQHYQIMIYKSLYSYYGSYFYERVDSSSGSVIRFDSTAADKERQVDSLFAAKGDTFRIAPQSLTIIQYSNESFCLNVANEMILGVLTETRQFGERNPSVVDAENENHYTLAKGFGLYSFTSSWYDGHSSTHLVYAKIDGKEYGTKIILDVNSHPPAPATFALFQNYPNPFNPSTAISYQLSALSYVSLKVYDVLGRLVATLVDGRQSVGEHSVIFDARHLSSGVYFYQLKTGGFVETKKMLVEK